MDDYDHGVEYTPKSVSTNPSLTLGVLRDRGIKYVRIQWVDLSNKTRFRIVPVSYFEKMFQGRRPGVGVASACLGFVGLVLVPRFEPMGEYLYVPDLSSLRVCPYAPGHASVLGWFHRKAPISTADGELSVEVDLCPRSLLGRVVEEAQTVSNVNFLVGFETEFILLTSTNPLQAINHHAWTASEAFPSGKLETIALEEIANDIQESDIELQMYHGEAAPGQYEVVTGPLPPLQAADALVHTREIIRNVAARYGLHATFAPRVYATSPGSAAHTNISVHSRNGEVKLREGLSTSESSFLAGVLEHLEALPALTLPIPASYKRVVDGAWSGGTYACWGTENREAPIRLVNATSPPSRRFEMRFVDATANPHLVLAGILTAGHDGIRKQQELKVRNCPGPKAAAEMSIEEREGFGITRRLPLTWQEARSNFEKDELFKKDFGDDFVTRYLSVNQVLGELLEQGDSEDDKLLHLIEYF
ncbi:hypothetical protein APHAL10511_002815 [Amanita phalloides]|nr:hypothetical protein APHAL10511_002815 [Amanita phalloides]